MATKYTLQDIIDFATVAEYQSLSPYQRQLVREFNEPISPALLDYYTGIQESQIIEKFEDYHGVGLEPPIHYAHGKAFVAKVNGSEYWTLFYIIQSSKGQEGFFGTPNDIAHTALLLRKEPGVGQTPLHLRPGEKLIIPTKRGGVTMNPRKITTSFSDQAIVRAHGGVDIHAVSTEQRPLVTYMRRHHGATLKQARAALRKRKK